MHEQKKSKKTEKGNIIYWKNKRQKDRNTRTEKYWNTEKERHRKNK